MFNHQTLIQNHLLLPFSLHPGNTGEHFALSMHTKALAGVGDFCSEFIELQCLYSTSAFLLLWRHTGFVTEMQTFEIFAIPSSVVSGTTNRLWKGLPSRLGALNLLLELLT